MPIKSYLCHNCLFEYDDLVPIDSPQVVDCPRCEGDKSAQQIPTIPASPRGGFGTVPRKDKSPPQEFHFNSGGQGELFKDEKK